MYDSGKHTISNIKIKFGMVMHQTKYCNTIIVIAIYNR